MTQPTHDPPGRPSPDQELARFDATRRDLASLLGELLAKQWRQQQTELRDESPFQYSADLADPPTA